MPALKLFDYNVSSSSDSEEEDDEEEEDEKESSDIKYENLGDQRMETELIMDSNFKISDDELSDELNECDAEKEHRKISLIESRIVLFFLQILLILLIKLEKIIFLMIELN